MIYIYVGVGLFAAYSVISTGKASPLKGVLIGALWPLLLGLPLVIGIGMLARHALSRRGAS